jgi:hypothetical protein
MTGSLAFRQVFPRRTSLGLPLLTRRAGYSMDMALALNNAQGDRYLQASLRASMFPRSAASRFHPTCNDAADASDPPRNCRPRARSLRCNLPTVWVRSGGKSRRRSVAYSVGGGEDFTTVCIAG